MRGIQNVERKPIGIILQEQGMMTADQVKQVLGEQKKRGGLFGKLATEMGFVTEKQVLNALGAQCGMEVVDLGAIDIHPQVVGKLRYSMAKVYRVIPIRFRDEVLTVAMADPTNISVLDDLRLTLNMREVKGVIASETAIMESINKYYAEDGASLDSLVSGYDEASDQLETLETGADSLDSVAIESMAHQVPVVNLLNLVLLQAINAEASDIHFEPFEDEFKIRYRVDGVLYEMAPPPKNLALAVISRIKVMANLDIAERRLPQDGRIELNISGRTVDLRVSTLPTAFGESVVLRVLDRSIVSLDLERIGLRDDEIDTIRDLLRRPNGIVLVTGPTGSGKTTTLYSSLSEMNDISRKIITTEDPVEYEIDGIIQVPIREEIGVTFAVCLRHILRQDPDIILVGEIRDLETAEIAIEAALTGHIVLSTLHTNDAPSTVTRLVDMGVEPYLLCATVEAVIAQRLVRSICKKCKEAYKPTDEMLMELDLLQSDVEGRAFYYGKGCDECNKTGYRGRTAIFEIMVLNPELREMILEQKSTDLLRVTAQKYGMRTLRDSGLLKIFDGITTIEEVVRESMLA